MRRNRRNVVDQLPQDPEEKRIVPSHDDAQDRSFLPRRSLEDLRDSELLDVCRSEPYSRCFRYSGFFRGADESVKRRLRRETWAFEGKKEAEEEGGEGSCVSGIGCAEVVGDDFGMQFCQQVLPLKSARRRTIAPVQHQAVLDHHVRQVKRRQSRRRDMCRPTPPESTSTHSSFNELHEGVQGGVAGVERRESGQGEEEVQRFVEEMREDDAAEGRRYVLRLRLEQISPRPRQD